jgi:hypothetical protein
MNISKELFTAVTGINLGTQESFRDQFEEKVWVGTGEYSNTIYYGVQGIKTTHINIYEFANKCKKWAFKNGFYLPIVYTGENTHCGISKTERGYIWGMKSTFIELSEPEAIFKACEYILSEMKEAKND